MGFLAFEHARNLPMQTVGRDRGAQMKLFSTFGLPYFE